MSKNEHHISVIDRGKIFLGCGFIGGYLVEENRMCLWFVEHAHILEWEGFEL
jgi:hypothetical protein